MKRDWELVRKLLFYFDEKPGSAPEEAPQIPEYGKDIIKYHLVLLYEAGFLRCDPITSKTSERVIYVLAFELTWQGHEFLDRVRSPHIWDGIISDIKRKGLVSTSVDVLKNLADTAIRRKLGVEQL